MFQMPNQLMNMNAATISGPDGFMDPAGLRPPQSGSGANRVSEDRRMLEQPWKDPRWFPITPDNIRENPFFEVNSDNGLIMMQNQPQMTGISGPQIDEKLKQMTGIQYVLHTSSPPLFVIRKQKRKDTDRINPLCHYYVLDGTIYQAPDLYTLFNSRLVGILDPLRKAFEESLQMLRFTPSKGYFWEFKNKPAKRAEDEEAEEMDDDSKARSITSTIKEEEDENPLEVRATTYQRLRTDLLLRELAERFKSVGKTGSEDVEAPSTHPHQQQQNGFPQHSSTSGFGQENPIDFHGLLFGHLDGGENQQDGQNSQDTQSQY